MADTHAEQFQRWLEETYSGDERFGAVHRLQGSGVDAGARLEAGEGSWYEVAVRLAPRDVRVGFLTSDRALNESICLLYTSPSPRDPKTSRMPSSA